MKTRAKKTRPLWTAARLVGAIWFSIIGAVMALIYVQEADFQTNFGSIFWIGSMIASMSVGWSFMGAKPGFGYRKSFTRGLASGIYCFALMVIWQGTLFAYANLSAGSFSRPEIIPGIWMDSVVRFAVILAQPSILFVAAIGGLIGGRIVGTVNWYYR